jgi:polyhydroxybutyrate depolymerase
MRIVHWAGRSLFRLAVITGVALAEAPWTARAGPSTAPADDIAPLGPGDHLRRLTVDGRRRSYWVHVPPGYDPSNPTPVVIAFHGALMNGSMMPAFTGLSAKADAAGFVVVYPNGLGVGQTALFFNAGAAPVGEGAGPADDVKFTAALLDDLARVVTVDRRRVFATGMSNGGMMAHRVAAELADRIAAAAPVAGTLALPHLRPSRPVPMMIFHGTADDIVPYHGRPGGRQPATMQFRSVPDTVQAWVDLDGCPAQGQTVATPDRAGDGTTITTTTYGPATGGTEVVLVRINGGGHTWPGVRPPVAFIGVATANVSADDLMWAFFQRHPMPQHDRDTARVTPRREHATQHHP